MKGWMVYPFSIPHFISSFSSNMLCVKNGVRPENGRRMTGDGELGVKSPDFQWQDAIHDREKGFKEGNGSSVSSPSRQKIKEEHRLRSKEGKDKNLCWIKRLEIALDSAIGLWFMHTYHGGCNVHRDIKGVASYFQVINDQLRGCKCIAERKATKERYSDKITRYTVQNWIEA